MHLWVGAFAVSLLVYVLSADRGPQWQDSGWQQWRIITGTLEHARGLALVHPLHFYLGRAVLWSGLFTPSFAITLVSCLAAAVGIANLAATLLVATGRVIPAILASMALMVSHTYWGHATHTESYSLVAALLTGEWLCIALFFKHRSVRCLLLLAMLNGLGVSNHLLAALVTPVDAFLIIRACRQEKKRLLLGVATVALWVVGTLPYVLIIVGRMVATGDVGGTIHSALFGEYASQVLNAKLGVRTLILSVGFFAYNFPNTVPIAGLISLLCRKHRKSPFFRLVVVELAIFVVFVMRYSIVDQYTYFFPVYAGCALLAGFGYAACVEMLSSCRCRAFLVISMCTILLTPVTYVAACSFVSSRGMLSGLVGNKPYRNGYRTFFIPWGAGDTYAGDLNAAVRASVADGGLVLTEDGMLTWGLRYMQATSQIPGDVEIIIMSRSCEEQQIMEIQAKIDDRLRAGEPVVLVPRDRDRPGDCVSSWQWERHGDIYLLSGPIGGEQ